MIHQLFVGIQRFYVPYILEHMHYINSIYTISCIFIGMNRRKLNVDGNKTEDRTMMIFTLKSYVHFK